jgi:septal ring factor EnvC (AmiA/AmiB activator)
MAEATQDLMYEILEQLQADMAEVKQAQHETNHRLNALTTHVVGLHQDVSNIYSMLTRQEGRLERIGRRLEISEAPV